MQQLIARILVVFLFTLFVGCEGRADGGRVSLMSLISNPERFVDEQVTVVGYHAAGLEPPLLYISKDHARLNDWPSGVLLYETVDGTRFSALAECQDQYVMVIGRYTLLPTEERGITDIVRVVALGEGLGATKTCFNSKAEKE
jgi:hypothetical protein